MNTKILKERKSRTQKGITLVALIITIIVLLILAVVAIRAVQGDGIIAHAKNAREKTAKAQAEEDIRLGLAEWKIVGNTGSTTLREILVNRFGAENVEDGANESYIVTVKGYEVTIDKDGNIVGEIEKTGPKPVISEIKVVENSNGTGTALAEKSIDDETKKLYITFTHAMTDGGTTTVIPAIPFEVSANGTYAFTVTGPNGESKIFNVTVNQYKAGIKIGDKVAYNEGYSADKTNTVDTNFKMDDMEWRVLDVDDVNGTVKLISTKPTTSKLTLSEEQGWLNVEKNLDDLCDDLYGNKAKGIKARSLKVEDIDKLANMLTPEARKAETSAYGTKWRYKYDPTAKRIQYSKQNADGTWTAYANTNYTKFKDPRNAEINSTHYQDTEGNPIIAELEYIGYSYTISSKIPSTVKTADNILVSDLISKGLNNTNDAANSSNIKQWLSSRGVACNSSLAHFGVRYVNGGDVNRSDLWLSFGYSSSPSSYAVRPVINLSSNVLTTKVDGTWQVNI